MDRFKPTERQADDIAELVRKAVEEVKAMSDDEREAMFRAQAESYARAEASVPAPKFKWVNGVKVYESYEDYCNG